MSTRQQESWPGQSDLLRTKLFVPLRRANQVPRPRLITRLNKSLDKALTLISAPAGFGKTTLLAGWVAQAPAPVAWISLDAEDNDPARFLAYLLAALARARGATAEHARALLQSPQPLPLQAILASLINDLAGQSEPLILILDDYQVISAKPVHDGMIYLLDHLPPQLHLAIATRADPPFPLARLRARNQMLELRTADLRFTGDEAAGFLNDAMALGLPPGDVTTLEERTEGWIAGLQMAALSVQGRPAPHHFITAFQGTQRYILEYLAEEVLASQPDEIQAFLLQTSVLERLCGPLCDTVLAEKAPWDTSVHSETGDLPEKPTRSAPAAPGAGVSGTQMLHRLEKANLFLVALDDEGYWFRYHHLFADFLQARLRQDQPALPPELHRRASLWFERHGLPDEAVNHALAAKNFERAASLIERHALDAISRGQLASSLTRINAIPEALARRRPRLCVYHAWALVFSGQLDAAAARLGAAEEGLSLSGSESDASDIAGNIALIRALMAEMRGDLPGALELAHSADRLLPPDRLVPRSIIPFIVGEAAYEKGDLPGAGTAYGEILTIGRAAGNLWTMAVALGKQANLKKIQGKLRAAGQIYREALEMTAAGGGQQYGTMGALYIGWADLLREQNELEAAQRYAEEAIRTMAPWPSPTDLANGHLILARISLALGDLPAAVSATERAAGSANAAGAFRATRQQVAMWQVRLWLAQGRVAEAVRGTEALARRGAGETPDDPHGLAGEARRMTTARVLLAQGRPDEALACLVPLANSARDGGRDGRLIEALMLQSLALWQQGQPGAALAALTALGESLSLAAPEGYLRIFVDEGEPLRHMLQNLGSQLEGIPRPAGEDGAHLLAYIQRLLSAFPGGPAPSVEGPAQSARPTEIIEPLSGRELEVLRLICRGYSNDRIAGTLCISPHTVKRHNNNIFGKLSVANRAQAIVRARDLHLIDD